MTQVLAVLLRRSQGGPSCTCCPGGELSPPFLDLGLSLCRPCLLPREEDQAPREPLPVISYTSMRITRRPELQFSEQQITHISQ